jgi:ATP-binding cassette subfamily F protein uup
VFSGGWQMRLALAKLLLARPDLLLLDEPTNHLDLEAVTWLEGYLRAYDGAVLLVSHDRAFVDNVVTQTLAPLGDGRWKEYVGGYTDWLAQRPSGAPGAATATASTPATPATASAGAAGGSTAAKPRRKLSYKEQKELDALPAEIEALEAEQRTLAARMSAPDYGQSGAGQIVADGRRIAEIEELLTQKLERWESLEAEVARLQR